MRELSVLVRALHPARHVRGGTVPISGEAGIGKTACAEALARLATRHGVLPVWGRCFEGDGAPAFWPWLQILRVLFERAGARDLLARMPTEAAVVAELLPPLGQELDPLPQLPALEPAQARFRMFDAVTRLLRTASQTEPLALLLDDLHWADTPSLRLLEFLARALAGSRLLLVGLYRDTDVQPGDPLTHSLAELVKLSHTYRLPLSGFDHDALAAFLRSSGEPQPAPSRVDRLLKETQGNPLFVAELVRLQPPTAGSPLSGPGERTGLPLTVRETIGRRLERLSPACRELLAMAAVAGREFEPAALALLSGEEALLDALAEAEAAHVVDVADDHRTYRFSHVLIREALYGELPVARRLQLYRRIGEAIESRFAGDPSRYAELAHHFAAGFIGNAGDAAKAVVYARKAGDHALAMHAHEEAVRRYADALRLLGHDAAAVRQRCELLLALGDAQVRCGGETASQERFRQAATLAEQLNEPSLLARAGLGWGAFGGAVAGGVDPGLGRTLRTALAGLAEAESTLRAKVLARLAIEEFYGGAEEQAARYSTEAVALARGIGDAAMLSETLQFAHYTGWVPASERLALATGCVRHARAAGDVELEFRSRLTRVADLLEVGEGAAVDRELATCGPLADTLAQPFYRARLVAARAARALLQGGRNVHPECHRNLRPFRQLQHDVVHLQRQQRRAGTRAPRRQLYHPGRPGRQ
jgi:hypothetical protein